MIRRVGNDWLHWMIGRLHFGFHRYGKCWSLFRLPTTTRYGNRVFWFSWWRFFVAFSIVMMLCLPCFASHGRERRKERRHAVVSRLLHPFGGGCSSGACQK